MSEGAALLVDHVLPAVGYRQWVLSFQGPLAVRLGYDTDLLAAVCEQLARALMQDLRRDVKRRHDLASVTPLHAGVMVAVQRAHADMDIDKFLARLCALVPPPGFHMVRYGGSQDSCRLRFYAAFFSCFECAESRSEFRLTTRMGDQFRVVRDQRSGCSALAAS